MAEFAEQEIVLPSGPYEGRHFSMKRQPWTRLWFAEVDSGQYLEMSATGPSQSGKTLCCSVIPALYTLFELGQTYIYGIPTIEMATDKWCEDFLPVIERSPFCRQYLPLRGSTARRGKISGEDPAVRFDNGATLKFMSGGGGDKKRAAFTSRFLGITETDGIDEAGGTSREADKISQMKARTQAFGDDARHYTECTMSIDTGYIHTTYKKGTASVIEHPCPHCGAWVSPEREHFVGWQEAESEDDARAGGHFVCPSCAAPLTEDERRTMNLEARLKHAKASRTLGFRWSAFQNLFVSSAWLAEQEWNAPRKPHEDLEETRLRQFIWSIPIIVESSIGRDDLDRIADKVHSSGRGTVPEGVEFITVGVDVGKHILHWTAIGWEKSGTGRIIDFGTLAIDSDSLGLESAVRTGLRQLRDSFLSGWLRADGSLLPASSVWCDAGYANEEETGYVIYDHCRQSPNWLPVLGRGTAQRHKRRYNQPKSQSATVRYVGDGLHIAWHKAARVQFAEVDADRWKSFVHNRLRLPADQQGSLTLFAGGAEARKEKIRYAKHLTAEYETKQFVVGKGTVVKWEQVRQANHWFDTTYYACAASSVSGVHQEVKDPLVDRPAAKPVLRRDGREWLSR